MTLKDQINLCSEHYDKWKNLALSAEGLDESRKCLEKAFFWLELQTAFITLFAIENTFQDSKVEKKLMIAKANLSKKLAEYAKEIISELGQ
ncbi:MAG TPA: hypothetical protein VJ343_00080 [archaeon]|nr:hypothetical protein [archaeon]